MAMLNHWSNFILLQPAQRYVLVAGGWAETRCRTGKNLTPRKMPENAAHTHLSTALREASPQGAVLGAFCLSQFTHKRTLPKNANQMKNTTKPNSFLARETIRGYTFDTNIHPPFRPPRLEPERQGRFQVFFGGKFCYQFYFVMQTENLPLVSRKSHA